METLWAYWLTTALFKRCYHWEYLWKRKIVEIIPPGGLPDDPYYITYIKYEVQYTNKVCGALCSYPVELDPGLKQVIKNMWNFYFNKHEKSESEETKM